MIKKWDLTPYKQQGVNAFTFFDLDFCRCGHVRIEHRYSYPEVCCIGACACLKFSKFVKYPKGRKIKIKN